MGYGGQAVLETGVLESRSNGVLEYGSVVLIAEYSYDSLSLRALFGLRPVVELMLP